MRSIQSRLLLSASVVLVLFLGLGAFALDRAFRDSVERALETQLMGQVYALLGAAETNGQGRMRLPETLPDPRLVSPDSGLYVQVVGERGHYQWRSPSSIARQLPPQTEVSPGQRQFDYRSAGESFYQLNYSLLWEDDAGEEVAYLFTVSENAAGVQKRVAVFRQTILLWLGGATFILLLLQGAVLRWGMQPLRTVENDLRMIETGKQEQLQGNYPRELQRLTQGINSLIKHNGASRDRYRHSLGDLAHSLKTPLAVLQGAAEERDAQRLCEAISEQIPRMNEIIQYQLKSAAVVGRVAFAQATLIRPIIDRLVNTLDKVYHEKSIDCRCDVDAEQLFTGEPGDLLECLGNLLENAYKYGHSQVHIYLDEPASVDSTGSIKRLCIADDGPGIPLAVRERVLRRGERADERIPGHGIGLSVAYGIVLLYGGKLEIGESPLGGALISIQM